MKRKRKEPTTYGETKKKEHDADAILMFTVLQAVDLYEEENSLAKIAEAVQTEENKMNPLAVAIRGNRYLRFGYDAFGVGGSIYVKQRRRP